MINELQQYMKNYNINQRQLASLLNINESHLSRVLSGKKKPGAKLLEKYNQLPGIREKEIIANTKELINGLYITDQLQQKIHKKILKKLSPGN